jgi:hypothetical protein
VGKGRRRSYADVHTKVTGKRRGVTDRADRVLLFMTKRREIYRDE